jgi:hypothetical protein
MKNTLFRKGLVVGIIVLFIGLAFVPSFNAVSISNNIGETNNLPPKIEIVEIVPFPFYLYSPNIGDLYIGARIKYIGDQTYEGHFGYHAEAYNMRTGELYTTYTQNVYGIIYPGEEYFVNNVGLIFDEEYFPTNFLVRFTPIPYGISKQETYRIWGGWTGAPPHCKKVNSKDLNLSPKIIDSLKLEDIPKVPDTVEDCGCNSNVKTRLVEKLINRFEKNEVLPNVIDSDNCAYDRPICEFLLNLALYYNDIGWYYFYSGHYFIGRIYLGISFDIYYVGALLLCWPIIP